jgi:hypothetical protein
MAEAKKTAVEEPSSAPSEGLGEREIEEALRSFLEDRNSAHWDGGQPLREDLSVSGTINRFRPQDVPDHLWCRVQDLVRDAVTKAEPERPFVADHEMSVVAQLVLWVDRIGQPLEPGVIFHPETIDRFIKEGCAHLTDGSRINYRTHLWKIGAAVLGHELFPPRSLALKRSALTPP